jgi:Uma2 family endonuclease
MNIPIRIIQNVYPMYPETDGLPMADNTLQYRWIVTIQGGLDAQFGHDPNVFVAGDLFWYPVEGHPEIVKAPDVMVALGRPREDRRSYMQWLENNVAPQVVFEILSPSNRAAAMDDKFKFYQRYGVEEYYIYNPDPGEVELRGWQRQGEQFVEIPQMDGWVSPRLGIRFDMGGAELRIFGADGRRFLSYLEVVAQRNQEEREKEQAQQQAAQAQQQSDEASRRAERLAAQLRALGIEPEA